MPLVLALLAALWLGFMPGSAAAQQDFQAGPANDPERCEELWKGIGLPDRKETTEETFTIVSSI